MKKLIILFVTLSFTFSMAQKNFDYESAWKNIDNSEKKGLNKSLLADVDLIYNQAKKDKNTPQLIRALLYQSKITHRTSDDVDIELKIIDNFKKEIKAAQPIEKAILQSMLAELYQNYYNVNQWDINNRTKTEESTGDDFRYWTENIFQQNILELSMSSIENKKALQKEAIGNWDYLLTKAEETLDLRPTLYDFLAHRTLGILQYEVNYYYGRNFDQTSKDQKKEYITQVLNDLISFHQQKKNLNAEAYNELELLKFQKPDFTDEEYEQKLLSLYKKHSNNSFSPYLLIEISNFYKTQVGKAETNDFARRKELTEKSLHYLDIIINDFPKSKVVSTAKLSKESILAPAFDITIENYLIPNENTPIQINHTNLDLLYFKVLVLNKDDEKIVNDFRYAKDNDKQKVLDRILKKLRLHSEFDLKLKSFDDYQNHHTLAKLDPLPSGNYLILTSNHADFKVNADSFLLQNKIVEVTNHVIVFRGNEILLTERSSGHPIANKTIEVFEVSNNKLAKLDELTTNEFGLVEFEYNFNHGRRLSFNVKGEDVSYTNYVYSSSKTSEDEEKGYVKFFTDRAIYRPGQVLYFKAISYKESKKIGRQIKPNQNLTIELLDPNGKKVTELNLITNEFGSVSGEFVLPTSGITGNFSLKSDALRSYYSFSVEEYKRPKFEVEFDKVEDIFRLNEEITAKGKAVAYSGANIDHAKVTYRVYRQAIYPYWPWWRGFPNHSPSEEIAHGETTTDAEGKFEIPFTAKAATDKKTKDNPRSYTYRIVADVTDMNGETRSSEQSISVGDLRYVLDLNVNQRINVNQWDSIAITTNNLNGQFNPAKGNISLTKINPPNRVLRDNIFGEQDYQLFTKDEFIQHFPNEAYGDENDRKNWTKEASILNENFDTEKSKTLNINAKNWKEGYYILKGEIIDGEDRIPYEQLVYLYKTEKTTPVDNELFAVNLNQDTYQPGEQAIVNFSSATKDSEVLVQLEANGKIVKSEKIKLNQNVAKFSFPIKEEYVENVFVHYYFGKFNQAQSGVLTVNIFKEDTSLKITTSTLRDKLQPGDKETWELKVSGKNKDKFLAEILTTMYDASLDQFRSNSINFPMYFSSNHSKYSNWNTYQSFTNSVFSNLIDNQLRNYYPSYYFQFDELNWFGFHFGYGRRDELVMYSMQADVMPTVEQKLQGRAAGLAVRGKSSIDNAVVLGEDAEFMEDSIREVSTSLGEVQPRKILNETAFFYPHLKTDENGDVKIQFTTPESLTTWKFMAMAHTTDARTGYFETEVKTQKELMVVPNPPRFLREGDQITFSSKIINLSDKELNGQAQLMLFDAFTMQPIDAAFGNTHAIRNISVSKGNSDMVSWTLQIPKNQQAVVYRVIASAGDFSDGEESALPILTNRTLVTETLPIYVREGQTKNFEFEKLKNNTSSTLDHFKLTFEMTTNPIWYAIFSLPYLREYPYDCSEQVFARLYGNMISEHLINSNPKIKAVFDDWNAKGELKSKLEQNQELKALLLEETPWVRQAESEEDQMKRIALLFDLNQMSNEFETNFRKLQSKQSTTGGFPWFEGGYDNRYITTHIVSGFGKLKEMNIPIEDKVNGSLEDLLENAIRFIDNEMEKDWDRYQNNKKYTPSNYTGIQYLYARSYFLNKYPLNKKGRAIRDYYMKELNEDKFNQSLQTQAMLAMIFNRYGQKANAIELLTSIKDNSVDSDEMGMYWKTNKPGWLWYQAPIETQAMLIEAFDEVMNDIESVESMKVWLLKNRQTNRWQSTKATTEAVYALMNTGKGWTNAEDGISVKIGNKELDLKALENAPQSGSGYVKTSWSQSEIQPEMGAIEVQKTTPGIAWGAMYWQYFEDLDKITSADTSVKFKKELFLKKNSDKGPVLTKITESTPIEIGDLVTVRLEIQTDRDMEFVHIKDMRASGFEPVNVFSRYKYQGGLGYYESTRDAATNFFIDRMNKGTYVFEYDVRANNAGNFSNGITSLQNMYAPELSAHSEGIRVEIK